MLPITNREREVIVFHKKNEETSKNISKWLRVSVRSITRIWNNYKKTGNIKPKPQNSGRKPLVTIEQMEQVINKIKFQPDITLNQLIDEFTLGISESALCKRLKVLGYTFKKRLLIR